VVVFGSVDAFWVDVEVGFEGIEAVGDGFEERVRGGCAAGALGDGVLDAGGCVFAFGTTVDGVLLVLKVPFAATSCNIFDDEGVRGVACFAGTTVAAGFNTSTPFPATVAFPFLTTLFPASFPGPFTPSSTAPNGAALLAFVGVLRAVVFFGGSATSADAVSSTTFLGRPLLRTTSLVDIVVGIRLGRILEVLVAVTR
jgi:hypothetical protein